MQFDGIQAVPEVNIVHSVVVDELIIFFLHCRQMLTV